MNGGQDRDGGSPCSEVRGKLCTYIDGELEESTCDEIKEHLASCAPCLTEYALDEAVKKLVAKHCGCDAVPLDLRDKVLGRLAQARTQQSAPETEVRSRETPA